MKYIGEDKPIVEYTYQATRFEDSDNMPDDPEQQDLEEAQFNV